MDNLEGRLDDRLIERKNTTNLTDVVVSKMRKNYPHTDFILQKDDASHLRQIEVNTLSLSTP